jgi:hypothetical protein
MKIGWKNIFWIQKIPKSIFEPLIQYLKIEKVENASLVFIFLKEKRPKRILFIKLIYVIKHTSQLFCSQ